MNQNLVMLGLTAFSLMVVYDVFAACHKYLHLVRFHETFGIGDLKQTNNFVDLMTKLGLLLGIYFLLVTTTHTLIKNLQFTSHTDKQSKTQAPTSLTNAIEKSLFNSCWASLVFFALYATWVRHNYKSYKDIHRAMIYPTAFFFSRAISFVIALVSWAIDFPRFNSVPQIISVTISMVLLLETLDIQLIDILC